MSGTPGLLLFLLAVIACCLLMIVRLLEKILKELSRLRFNWEKRNFPPSDF